MTLQFLRIREVMARTGLARSTIYLWISQQRFPPPIAAGAASVWVASEVDDWMREKIRASRGDPAPVADGAMAS